jgi:hypothetical protein
MLPLSVIVRYDQRYSNAVGKWALNASNDARFCYPYEMPDFLQALPEHKAITKAVIAYERIIQATNVPEILQIDCTEADFFASQNSFETYLYFNPYDKSKKVNIDLGKNTYHLYDLNTKQIVAKSASGTTEFKIPAQSSKVLVLIPVDKALTSKDGKLYAGDVVVDYWFGKEILGFKDQ